MDSILIVGLGNPGSRYERTRHNVGFRVVAALCTRFRDHLRPGKGEYHYAVITRGPREIVLLAPVTFMNNSGIAVADALERWAIAPQQMLVVVDDFWLPLGTLRFRTKGSDGGHNGLASIIETLGSDGFPRLRCGIKRDPMPPKDAMADFVLSPFDADEEDAVSDMTARAADAALEFAFTGRARPANRPAQ